MNIEDNPYAKAMLSLHEKAIQDVAMLRAAFVADALGSGRHTRDSVADLLERTAKDFSLYENSPTEHLVKMLRDGDGPPFLRVIEGGKTD